MSEQSVIDSFLRGAWFRGRLTALRPLAAASSLPLSAILLSALPAGAFAQYPAYTPNSQSPQPTYNYASPPQAPISNPAADPGPVAGQLAGQSDQQLAAEARLFEQQGRTAQAQRIYLELNRRSLLRGQTPQTSTFNGATPKGSSAYAPNAAAPTPTAGGNPSNGLSSVATNQNQIGSAGLNPALRPYQPTPFPAASVQASQQFQGVPQPSAEPAAGWMTPAGNAQPNVQTADGERFPRQEIEAIAGQSAPAVAPSSPNAGSADSAPTSSLSTTRATPPVMVLDRQVSPAPRRVEQTSSSDSTSGGWRAAITPLPAALADPGAKPAPTPGFFAQHDQIAGRAEQPGSTNSTPITEAHPLDLSRPAEGATIELPNIPALPVPDMPGLPTLQAPARAASPAPQEPAAFLAPATRGERLLPPGDVSEPAGVVMFPSTPPTLKLSPTEVPKTVSVQADQEISRATLDAAAKLAKETDDIRIIPGNRGGGGQSRLETLLNVDSKTEAASDTAFGVPTTGWKSTFSDDRPHQKSVADDAHTVRRETSDEQRPASRANTRSAAVVESADAGEPRDARPARSASPDVERPAGQKTAFDLAALIRDPEFREIHTRPVLDGLDLLSQAEPRHRLLGALRLGMSGPDARTALPVLHQLLGIEPNLEVRLRVAETVLKLQPNDRPALDALAHLLKDPADADVRQAAAGALGGASPSGNLTAIIRLTDALDDPNPRVRIMAALTLAQFGPAAADAVPRLEVAASNDVPRMQRAALAALASIRGGGPAARNSGAADSGSPATSTNPGVTSFDPALESREPSGAATSVENRSISPAKTESTGPKPLQLEPEEVENPVSNPQTMNSDPRRVTPAAAHFEPNPFATPTFTASSSKMPVSPRPAPAPRVSLHEIDSDVASVDSRTRSSGEPPLLPDLPAKPIKSASTKSADAAVHSPPSPVLTMPKAAADLPPLSEDSPLSLESQAGDAKSGSTP